MAKRTGKIRERGARYRLALKAAAAGRGGVSSLADLPGWKFEDAKAKFSELVRRARAAGPQRVTVRGQDAVVVLSAAEFEKLRPPAMRKPTMLEFMRLAGLGQLLMPPDYPPETEDRLEGLLLDSNVLAEALRDPPSGRVHAWLVRQPGEIVFVSVLALAELDKGLAYLPAEAPGRPALAAAIRELERMYRDRILPISDPVVRRWGGLRGAVKRITGQSPPVVDTLLAATALIHDLHLATRNVRDMRHTGASLFNPWTDDPAHFPVR